MSGPLPLSLAGVQAAFPEFVVQREFKVGGMKRVYDAKRTADEQRVALKIIPVAGPGEAERVRREVEAMRALSHPNLTICLEAGVRAVDGHHAAYIIECFADGSCLADVIKDGQVWEEKEVKEFARALLGVAFEMHAKRLVHRDIKPDNIILKPDGSPLVLDLGISRHLALNSLTPTWAPNAPFTPGYCSPEQITNQKQIQDSRTDLFLIGIVVFEMATGRHPFIHSEADDAETVCRAIHEGRCIDPKKARSDLSNGFCAFLGKLLMRQPYQRYQNPKRALDALDRLG